MNRDDDFSRIEARAESVVESTRSLIEDLVNLRGAHDLTQADLAERMGVSQPSVAAFERHDGNPTLRSIERYAIAVGARLNLAVVNDYSQTGSGSTSPYAGWEGTGVFADLIPKLGRAWLGGKEWSPASETRSKPFEVQS